MIYQMMTDIRMMELLLVTDTCRKVLVATRGALNKMSVCNQERQELLELRSATKNTRNSFLSGVYCINQTRTISTQILWESLMVMLVTMCWERTMVRQFPSWEEAAQSLLLLASAGLHTGLCNVKVITSINSNTFIF